MNTRAFILLIVACLWQIHVSLAEDKLRLSEVMYHPVEHAAFDSNGVPLLDLTEDVHEFVELYNAGTTPVTLTGWRLSGGISFDFPAGITVPPAGFIVVAKNPARLVAVAAYGLTPSQVVGPFSGQLSNEGDNVRVENALGQVIDAVNYSAGFPWAIGADSLGADDEWTGLDSSLYQYRGRSLERVSYDYPATSPANWIASPLPGGPSPGHSNSTSLSLPRPVVTALTAVENSGGTIIIRANQVVKLDITFSATNQLSNVSAEYFIDNINATNEAHLTIPLLPVTPPESGRYSGSFPGQADRSVVRYRIRADRGSGVETVSPRADDPFGWHAYFVTPARAAANPVYDCFISTVSLTTLATNVSQMPRRIVAPDPPGFPRVSWNGTEPAIFVFNGEVFDIQMRHHGSRYNRGAGRNSFKWQFPRYHRFEGNLDSFFVTDKGEEHRVGGQLYDAADLPAWRCRYVDLYMNGNARLQRLQQDEMEAPVYRRWAIEQATRYPGRSVEDIGRFFKASGVIPYENGTGQGFTSYLESGEGPYYIGNCALPPARSVWTVSERCEWTYGPQVNAWKGGGEVAELLTGLWAARGDTPLTPNPNLPTLRNFLAAHFDIDATLTYIAIRDWSGPFDNATHNYFLWRRANGRWSMLPWDLDSEFDNPPQPIFWDEQLPAQPDSLRGPHWLKDSFYKAFREEYKQKLWHLNNTLLNPADFVTNGWGSLQSFASARFTNVNNQLGLGVYQRPNRPTNAAPLNGQSVLAPASLVGSPYAHSMNPPPAHATTTWLIRHVNGTYAAPVFRVTTSSNLTSIPIPFADLKFGERYFWRYYYTDTNGHPSLVSAETSFLFGGPAVPGQVVLNEILAHNRSSITNGNTVSDYVELHNVTDQPQSLAAFSLTDNLFVPDRFLFPPGTSVPARGYLLVWCDRNTNAPGLHTGFGLDNDGQTLALFAVTGNGFQLSDTIAFGLQLEDRSIGRLGEGTWNLNLPTPGATNQAAALGLTTRLQINEWLAASATDPDWLELYNPESLPVALGGLFLSDSASNLTNSSIAALSFIQAQGHRRFFADQDLDQGARHVDFRLGASGDSIILSQPNRTVIQSVTFGAQMVDVSQGRLPDGGTNIVSFPPSAVSPEAANHLPITDIIINEVLPDIELFNAGLSPVNLNGWWLSDEAKAPLKYQLPNTQLNAGGYFQITAATLPFQLNAIQGGMIVLSHDGTHQSSIEYGPYDGHSYGPVSTSSGRDFVRLSSPTFGGANTGPQVGPIVISEIQYHPPSLPGEDEDYEFLELVNVSAAPVDLFRSSSPQISARLRDAVSYAFPPGTILDAGERILVLGFDPATNSVALSNFLAFSDVPVNLRLFGPYAGKLDNDHESVELVQDLIPVATPGPDYGTVPSILLERVNYADSFPWPRDADGQGSSLQRRVLSSYGNEATNWIASGATPGTINESNAVPTVVLTAPGNGVTIGFGQPITLTALTTDRDGFVRLVEFFVDGTPLFAAFNSQPSLVWSNAPAGPHQLTARATDNHLGRASSATVNIVVSNQPPVVTLLRPANGATYLLPTNVLVEASASDADGNILQIDLFDNGLRLDTALGASYSLVITNLRPGIHVLTARATDSGGAISVSPEVTVTASRPSYISHLVPAGTIGTQPFGGGLGMDFNVTIPILVTRLGVFDSGADGIAGGSILTAQIYARTGNVGTVLATLNFNAADSGTLIEGSRFKSLPQPLLLNPGGYSIVAYGFDAGNPEGNIGTGNAKSWTTEDGGLITFSGSSRYGVTGNTPGTFPSTPDGGPVDRYAAGTFEFRPIPVTPVIVSNPANAYVNPGASAAFSVGVAGATPLRYQWSFNNVLIANETNGTLTIPNAQFGQRGLYRVRVSNSFGSVESEPALLDILVDPIIVQPPLSQVVVTGATVTLSVVVTNTATLPIGYRWRRNGATIAFLVLTQHVAFFTITNAVPPAASYSVVVTNILKQTGNLSAVASISFSTDTDGDGLPDAWETAYGLNPAIASDAGLDADGDGVSNRDEYNSGTNPTNALSQLRIESFVAHPLATLGFSAVSNKTYTVQFSEWPEFNSWQVLERLPARATNRLAEAVDPGTATNRFYRVATPQ